MKIKVKIREEYSFGILTKRIVIGLLSFVILFLALVARLFFVQTIDGVELRAKASLNWARSLPLNAKRGEIYDINGVPLAVSKTTYDVYVKGVNVKEPEKLAMMLCNVLSLEYEKTLEKVKSRKTSEVLIKMQVGEKESKEIIAANLAGVYLTENLERVYPFGDLLTQILGYTTIDNIGQTGVELYYDKYLKGLNGRNLMETDGSGVKLEDGSNYYLPAIDGMDVTLTIDSSIQIIMENALTSAMEEFKAKGALGIIMDAETGGIIAASNKPSFNLNEPMRDDIITLNQLSKSQAVSDVYEPGSTFKLFTTAAALEEGLTRFEDRFFCAGNRIIDGQRIKCWRTRGHGSQDLVEGVSNSCNCVFMDLGLRLGTSKLYDYLRKFGMGTKTGLDFFGETNGILMPEKNVKVVDLARISFGHAVAVSAMQLVTGVTSVINGGKLLQPHLLQSVNNKGQNIFTANTTVKRQTISAKTSADMRYLMKEAVDHANAVYAYVPGYSLGGKTGTAQKYVNGSIAQGKYVSSFVGFAPYENPKYVLLLLVDEPSTGAYYGSVVAAPKAKMVFEQIFETKNIAPTGNIEEEKKRFELNITVPNIVGLTETQAEKLLRELGLQLELEGGDGTIHSQYPSAGAKLFKNAIVAAY